MSSPSPPLVAGHKVVVVVFMCACVWGGRLFEVFWAVDGVKGYDRTDPGIMFRARSITGLVALEGNP